MLVFSAVGHWRVPSTFKQHPNQQKTLSSQIVMLATEPHFLWSHGEDRNLTTHRATYEAACPLSSIHHNGTKCPKIPVRKLNSTNM